MTQFTNEFAPDLDLAPLQDLKKIRKLLFYGSRIANVKPISYLTTLQTLDLGETAVQTGIRELANLSTTAVFLVGSNNIPCADLAFFAANHTGFHWLPEDCKP
ncbi:MAG: hypothetical protein K8S54_12855 [Spirochaetia bacterium]|nr:hypothetical protein [Spirochaetia bacterium]